MLVEVTIKSTEIPKSNNHHLISSTSPSIIKHSSSTLFNQIYKHSPATLSFQYTSQDPIKMHASFTAVVSGVLALSAAALPSPNVSLPKLTPNLCECSVPC